MTTELKAQLFDEIVNNMDNDHYIGLNNGSISYRGGNYYISSEDYDVPYKTIGLALEALGYDAIDYSIPFA